MILNNILILCVNLKESSLIGKFILKKKAGK